MVDEFASWWQEQGFTALVMPAFPNVAVKMDAKVGLTYTAIWNVMGNPAGVMPVTTVREDEQEFEESENASFRESAKDSAGLPVSVQVVAYTHEDEKLLVVMKHLEAALRNSEDKQ